MRSHRTVFFLLIALWSIDLLACDANTELEKSYCKLRSKGALLPSMDDFRRNNTRMQYLLLKRPAQQAGIKLPVPVSSKATREAVRVTPSKTVAVAADPVAAPRRQQRSLQKTIPTASDSDRASSLVSSCRLVRRAIFCDAENYGLVDNLRNSELASGALLAANALKLRPVRSMSPSAMTRNYQEYLEKMLYIGLGGATMSYSQFFYTWQAARERGDNAVRRFSAMYEFLKRDKLAMGIQRQFDERLPSSLNQCMRVSVTLLVCDEGRRNWVFTRS